MPVQVRPSGPVPARLMLVGEAPGADEEAAGEPFVGASGQELNRMLHDAGVSRSECFTTNVIRERPLNNDLDNFIAARKKDITSAHTLLKGKYVKRPVVEGFELLKREITMVQPNVVIAFGNTAMWALTGLWGIMKWRGSMLYSTEVPLVKVIPTFHPAAVLREWSWRYVAVHDIRRAARFRNGEPYPDPGWKFIVRPSFTTVCSLLEYLTHECDSVADGHTFNISFDLETKCGHIDCAGLAWTLKDALCIPFWNDYWSEDDEAHIVYLLYKLLTHPKVGVIGQNLLYDAQYTFRHWHFIPRITQDTMLSHHVAFSGLPKKLDFQASMYCDFYRQWKPDKSAWKEGG